MKFYTSVHTWGSNVLYRGYDHDGNRVHRRVNDFQPVLYRPHPRGEFKNIYGEPQRPIFYDDLKAAKESVKNEFGTYTEDGVANPTLHGQAAFQYQYINDQHPGEVQYDRDKMRILNFDIEVASENGFPKPDLAMEPVLSIAMSIRGRKIILATLDFNPPEGVKFVKCRSEIDLLLKFLDIYRAIDPDILTGWNVEFFDIPYLYNRITNVMGEKVAKKLSPWNIVLGRTVRDTYGERQTYMMYGVAIFDYLQLYKKFTYHSEESYTLDYIASVVLKDRQKVDYSEYGKLHLLYKHNPQKFFEYNIGDVELVDEIDQELGFIDIALAMTYDSKSNLADVFGTVRPWDTMIEGFLLTKGIVVSPNLRTEKTRKNRGAFVKPPIVGAHGWVVSFDYDSLYPHMAMMFNIGPDTITRPFHQQYTIAQLVNGSMAEHTDYLKENNLTVAANGWAFRRDRVSFLSELFTDKYAKRVMYKKRMIEASKRLAADPTDKQAAREKVLMHHKQMSLKIQLNSAYGMLSNEHCRWYNMHLAEAITLSGQLCFHWAEKTINDWLNDRCGTEGIDFVIAGDTDSLYIRMDELVKLTGLTETREIVDELDRIANTEIKDLLATSFNKLADQFNAVPDRLHMSRELIGDMAIWTSKKHYVMNVLNEEGVDLIDNPKLKVVGIEAVKSSTPSVCREAIKKGLKIAMRGTQDEFHEFVQQFKEEFVTLPFESVAFPRSANKIGEWRAKVEAAGTYKKQGVPAHIRAVLRYKDLVQKLDLAKELLDINEGEKIKFCYIREPNITGDYVFATPHNLDQALDLTTKIDYDKQFEKAFAKPIHAIVAHLGWTVEPVDTVEGLFR